MNRKALSIILIATSYLIATISTQTDPIYVWNDNYLVTFYLQNSVGVTPPTDSSDGCGKMMAKEGQLFHMKTNNNSSLLERWDVPFTEATSTATQWQFQFKIVDYATDYYDSQFALYESSNSTLRFYQQLTSTTDTSVSQTMINDVSGKQVMLIDQQTTMLYSHNISASGGVQDVVKIVTFDPTQIVKHNVPYTGAKSRLTPDKQKLIIWDQHSRIYVYSTQNYQLVGQYTETYTQRVNLTNYIDVDVYSQIAIIQTDGQHPIIVLDLHNMEVYHQLEFDDTIIRASFIPYTDLILIITPTQMHLHNTFSGYSEFVREHGYTVTTTLFNGEANRTFLCQNNKITEIVYEIDEYYDPYDDPDAVYDIWFEGDEEEATQTIATSLQSTTSVIDKLLLIAFSNPFTYYFLSFLNFFTIASHYMLLDMPIPKQLYKYLSKFYVQINMNAVSRLWVLPWKQPTLESVTRKKLLSVSLTTDLAMGQTANILMAVINVIAFQFISYLVKRLDKKSIIRKLLFQPKSEIIYGQYVSLMLPLTCPWIFFMFGGVKSTVSGFNLVLQYVFFGLNMCFCVYYIFQLMDDRAAQIVAEERKIEKLNIQKKRRQELRRRKRTSQQQQNKPLSPEIKREDRHKFAQISPSQEVEKRKVEIQTPQKLKALMNKKRNPSAFKELATNKTNKVANSFSGENLQLPKKVHKPVKVIPFSKLITAQIAQNWYIVFCNFLYPLALVLPWPEVPLVLLFFYSLLGVVIANRLQQYRLNKVILALYPVLYHACFVVFRATSHNKTNVYTQMVALGLLFAGSVHHSLFIFYTFGKTIYHHYQGNNQVSPCNEQQNGKQQVKLQVTEGQTDQDLVSQADKKSGDSNGPGRDNSVLEPSPKPKTIMDNFRVKKARDSQAQKYLQVMNTNNKKGT